MLYAAGGLLLGESVILTLTEGEAMAAAACLGAAGAIAYWCLGKNFISRLAGAFARELGKGLALFLIGLLLGAACMVREKALFAAEEAYLETLSDGEAAAFGTVLEIGKSASKYRLTLGDVSVFAKTAQEGEELSAFAEERTGAAGAAGSDGTGVDGAADSNGIWADKTAAGGWKIRRVFCYVDEVSGLKLGMRVRVWGEAALAEGARNRGGFDFRAYCRSLGVGGLFYGDSYAVTDGRYRPVPEALRQLRLRLSWQLSRIAGEDERGILQAVLLGEKSGLSDSVYEMYRRNGISHLLAISGLHVSIIGLGIWKLLRRLGFNYGSAGEISGLLLFAYGVMAGFGPSVVRAVTMAAISFLAAALGRTYDMPSALCVPLFLLLLTRPYLLTQAGFQLSFLAVGAICFPGQLLGKRLEAKGFSFAVLVSLSIQLVTAPVILYHSFELPVYGIFLNLIVIPLMSYVAASGILGVIVSFFMEEAGLFCLGTAHYILRFYEFLCHIAERLPGAVWCPGRPAAWQIAGYYLALLLAVWLACGRDRPKLPGKRLSRTEAAGREAAGTGKSRRDKTAAADREGKVRKFLRFLAVSLAAFLFLLPLPKGGLSVTFLDVGQGDGIVLEAEGKRLLVDCGSSQEKELAENCLLPFLKSGGIRRLDAVLVSHGDSDHISAIRGLLEQGQKEDGEQEQAEEIAVGVLILPAAGRGEEVYEELEQLAAARGIPVRYLAAGDALNGLLGEKTELRCLYPAADAVCTDRNEESLVLSVRYGDFSLLLTGDIEAQGESALLAGGMLESQGPYTVLKAAHHGSATSTGEEFLAAVRPRYAILSYGEGNRYGHPAPEVVERLRKQGTQIHETAKEGAVTVWTDGERLRIAGFAK